ncbi:MAG: hypothetical protein JNL83_24220 [Myxococcales bacterium]|nr:hypothetical protein [Myxococcales bacterium]
MRRALAVVSLLAISPIVRADGLAGDIDRLLADARAAEAALDYEKALALVERLISTGAAVYPAAFVELELTAGRLSAGLDRVQQAEDHYARALAIDPAATLPAGTSPKLTAPLDAARARTTPLKLSVIAVDGAVSFLVDADALGLVRGIALTINQPDGTGRTLVERGATRLAVPKDATAVEVAAIDAHGNTVWKGVPPEPRIMPPPIVTRAERPGVATRWSTWAIATGVVLGAGAFSAWRFNVAQNEWNTLRDEPDMHDFSELTAVEHRGRRWGLAANIAFGVATAAGIATVVLYYRQRSGSRVIVSPTGVGGEF